MLVLCARYDVWLQETQNTTLHTKSKVSFNLQYYSVFGLYSNKWKTAFWKVDLAPSSYEGR
jgi:hypothetical protein